MKVPRAVIEARRQRLAALLQEHRYLPVRELCRLLGVSEATARRDLAALADSRVVTRTYGGALSEFNARFPSFGQRRQAAASAKQRLARIALRLLEPGQTVYLDSGTTLFALAEELRAHPVAPLNCVTGNLPVAECLAQVDRINVHLIAGQLLPRQSVLLGPEAARSVRFWQFDLALLSAQAMRAEGIFNSSPAIVDLQQAVLSRTRHAFFLLDASKIDDPAPALLAPWSAVPALITDATPAAFGRAGISTDSLQILRSPKEARLDDFSSDSDLTLPDALL